ncbi:MAG: Asp-tRNA(Asn)/Glu-tRNA(Gln) amidotransferase subunit GatC [Planctomycetes bacterium]|nr:Asp-tRNA(Asn)/Glu-tRNA(Gln) amidotransferase subunit GatC [Planctomycetota bacterium]
MIRDEEVRHIAHLARLELSEPDLARAARELGSILDYVKKLEAVDTADVEPEIHAVSISNVYRKDEPRPSLPRDEALAPAPSHDDKYFRVPKVIE